LKCLRTTVFICFISLAGLPKANGQILISLIFGDKLNSEKIEFGLEGGLVNSRISGLEPSEGKLGFNLGFYFDFMLKGDDRWWLATGVIVKSPMGADGLDVYPTGDTDLDGLLQNGEVTRKIRYFNVPAMIKYRFPKGFFAMGGLQLGLLSKAFDEFSADGADGDLLYTNNIKEHYKTIDAGFSGGVGYRLRGGNGMNLELKYYRGFVGILKGNPGDPQYNSALYVNVGIPIGVGKKNEAN
jgi:hypothetical protein